MRGHALATQRLWRDPDAGFAYAVEEAKRMVSLGPERQEALDADAQEAPGADGPGTPGAGGPEGSGAGRREE